MRGKREVSIPVSRGASTTLLPEKLLLREGCFMARLLDVENAAELRHAYQLRYEYFVTRKQWVISSLYPGLECDAYDAQAWHLGVFHHHTLVGYLRVIDRRATCGFMLEHDFRHLVETAQWLLLQEPGSIELSRLVVDKRCQPREVKSVLTLLFKLLYQFARQSSYDRFLIVTESHWLPMFARRFKFRFAPLGPTVRFPDGTITVAAAAAVQDLEMALRLHDPSLLIWYENTSHKDI